MKKLGKDLNRHFTKEDIGRAKKALEKMSTLLVIREMQIKIIMKYHIMPAGMSTTEKLTTPIGGMWSQWEDKMGQPL